MNERPIPEAVYPCRFCHEEYSWPPLADEIKARAIAQEKEDDE